MLKNLTQIYCLIICLVATITLMITLGVAFNSVTEIALTEYKFASSLDKFSSNEKYIEYKTQYNSDKKNEWDSVSSEEIKEKRKSEKESYIESRKKEAFSTIISCTTWLFVAALFFIVHWRLHKKYSLSS
ncbi:MAG: hypothetical protein AAF673_01360 [Pseudomonadota bacterium]